MRPLRRSATKPSRHPGRLRDRRAAARGWRLSVARAGDGRCASIGTVDSDVAWQLWIARPHSRGRPPLPRHHGSRIRLCGSGWRCRSTRIAWLFHVAPKPCSSSPSAAWLAGALSSRRRIDRRPHRTAPPRRSSSAMRRSCYAAMPWVHVGQREQIVLIVTVPYAALVAARAERDAVSTVLALLVGAGAGLGFALKHYFLIVPAILELWLRGWPAPALAPAASGDDGTGRRRHTVMLRQSLLFAPDFITRMVPLIRLAYGVFGAPEHPMSFRAIRPRRHCSASAALALRRAHHCWRRRRSLRPHRRCSRISAVYFIQSKGWLYHAIPLLGCASLGARALLAEAEEPPRLAAGLRPCAPCLAAGRCRRRSSCIRRSQPMS